MKHINSPELRRILNGMEAQRQLNTMTCPCGAQVTFTNVPWGMCGACGRNLSQVAMLQDLLQQVADAVRKEYEATQVYNARSMRASEQRSDELNRAMWATRRALRDTVVKIAAAFPAKAE